MQQDNVHASLLKLQKNLRVFEKNDSFLEEMSESIFDFTTWKYLKYISLELFIKSIEVLLTLCNDELSYNKVLLKEAFMLFLTKHTF